MILTDPPYSEYTHANAKSNRDKGHGNVAIDFEPITLERIAGLFATLGERCPRWLVATMDWRHIAEIAKAPPGAWEFVRFGVWVKPNPMPQISADRPANGWDGILYMHNRNARKEWNGGGNHGNFVLPVVTGGDHPTSKPAVMLEQMIIRHSQPGDVILDPFMGGGSTGVAAVKLGRKFIGIELDPTHYATARRRIDAQQRQGALFEPAPPKPEQTGLF
jgi:site-specific DNA-methyltransferase (adenine-specific)